MSYSDEQLKQLHANYNKVVGDLQSLIFEGLKQSESIESEEAKRQLQHGVGRRLEVLKRSVEQIFTLFPPSQKKPLQQEKLIEVRIYLHALLINLSGIFDNWAWAFLFRHRLNTKIDKRNISLFKKETQRLLPKELSDYLASADILAWYENYLKGYRDALAHRIPLYIPPASWTDADTKRYQQLEKEKIECINQGEWDRLDAVSAKQGALGQSCPIFLHEYSGEENSRPIYLHPQILCDGMTVVEFGKRYYAIWHERTQ